MSNSLNLSVAVMAALLALAGCNSNSSGGNGPAAPVDYKAEAMSAKKLTDADKAYFKNMQKDSGGLPSSSLYYDDYSNDADRQKALAKLDDNGRALLARVKVDCKIDKGQERTSGTSEVGKTKTVEKDQSISGERCPVSNTTKTTTRSTTTAYDQASARISAQSESEATTHDKVLDNSFKKGKAAIEIRLKTSSRTSAQDLTSSNGTITGGTLRIQSSISGTVELAHGAQAVVSMKYEYVAVPNSTKLQMLTRIKFSDGPDFVMATVIDGTSTLIIINGEEYTVERVKQELGMEVGSMAGQK